MTDTETTTALHSKASQLTAVLYDAALEYLDRGWSIIPISIESKTPLIEWRDYQNRQPTYEEVSEWFESGVLTKSGTRIKVFNIGLATGAVSGIVVVDADNEAAIQHCKDNKLVTAFSVKTTRGRHYYFKHPRGSVRFGNKAGASAQHDPDWPSLNGLDFRGDGGYVVLPPSVKLDASKTITHQYEWELAYSNNFDEAPVWEGTKPMLRGIEAGETKSPSEIFATLDLTHVRTLYEDGLSVTRSTELRVQETGKIANGAGRGTIITRLVGELARARCTAPEIESRVKDFMERFFQNPLPVREYKATIRSILNAEARSNPTPVEEPKPQAPSLNAFTDDQIENLLANLKDQSYAIDPFLKHPSIVQVYGYTGHGKSWLTMLTLWHLARGESVGPFTITRPHSVAYIDAENGQATIANRMSKMLASFGTTHKRLKLISPAIHADSADMNLNTKVGLEKLEAWIRATEPEVVVIDTVRSAFLGMAENSAEGWSPMNQLALRLRNAGMSVIILHHANKPQDAGTSSGMEAGSTNQLSVIEQQIRIVQLYETEEKAVAKRGKFLDPARANNSIYMRQENSDDRLMAAFEWSYGKVREMTDNHTDVMIALMERADATMYVIADESPRQKAERLSTTGKSASIIARELGLPIYVVKKWLGEV
jgi:hypothetical protein